jgi:hypothetical protein
MTRSAKETMLAEPGAVPVVADALEAEQVAQAVGRARPDVIVHQLTALTGVERYTERDAAATNRLGGTEGLAVLWVGVRCDGEVAAAREVARGDRAPGMAALQAESVRAGVSYDLEVDTGVAEALACAHAIAARVV